MEKIYQEILSMKMEIQELKQALIPEVMPEDDEREALRVMEQDVKEGKHRPWRGVKKELESE